MEDITSTLSKITDEYACTSRVVKEFEKYAMRLQTKIDELETEKQELKNRVKETAELLDSAAVARDNLKSSEFTLKDKLEKESQKSQHLEQLNADLHCRIKEADAINKTLNAAIERDAVKIEALNRQCESVKRTAEAEIQSGALLLTYEKEHIAAELLRVRKINEKLENKVNELRRCKAEFEGSSKTWNHREELLKEKIASLQQQLTRQKELAHRNKQSLKAKYEAEIRKLLQNQKTEIRENTEKLIKQQDQLSKTFQTTLIKQTKKFEELKIKQEQDINSRFISHDMHRLEMEALQNKLAVNYANDLSKAEETIRKHCEIQEGRKRQQELSELENKFAEEREIQKNRMKHLEGLLEDHADEYKMIQKSRTNKLELQMESFRGEIANARELLAHMEGKLSKKETENALMKKRIVTERAKQASSVNSLEALINEKQKKLEKLTVKHEEEVIMLKNIIKDSKKKHTDLATLSSTMIPKMKELNASKKALKNEFVQYRRISEEKIQKLENMVAELEGSLNRSNAELWTSKQDLNSLLSTVSKLDLLKASTNGSVSNSRITELECKTGV